MSDIKREELLAAQRRTRLKAEAMASRAARVTAQGPPPPSLPVVGVLTPVKVIVGGALFVGALLLLRRMTR